MEHLAEGMRQFDRSLHDSLVLDDLRDFAFCVKRQEKLQGKVDKAVELASTPGGKCAYQKWLWRVSVVFTADYTTRSRELLESNDFLGNSENRVVVTRVGPPTCPFDKNHTNGLARVTKNRQKDCVSQKKICWFASGGGVAVRLRLTATASESSANRLCFATYGPRRLGHKAECRIVENALQVWRQNGLPF